VRLLACLVLVTAAAAVAAGTGSAAPTNECRGFDVCVPVAGPWVLASAATRVEFQLVCPRRFAVGGLDAELSSRAIDIAFLGKLGSPVGPGTTTSDRAVFVARFVGRAGTASFRPHIGCIPTAGGGQGVPTALRKTYPPGAPTVRRTVQVSVRAGATRHLATGCRRGERLAAATTAVGFYRQAPPTSALASAVRVTQRVRNGRVELTVRAGAAVRGTRAIVQLDLLCAR
jgi:hypothetical protein